jgi:predicted AlkP superfamily phosphohydrolase/phosphomutase
MTRPKAFILGLDGGTWDLIDRFMAEGKLPTFASLKRESAWAATSTTWPAHTGPGWASFVTGCMPGSHGIFQFFDTQEPNYRGRIVGTRDFGCRSCWEWAAANGLTLGLVNIPMSHPAVPLPGYQITWPLKQTTKYCDPPHLLSQLARDGCHFQSDLGTMFRGNMDYIHHAPGFVSERMRTCRQLIGRRDADIFAVVLTEVDRVCHHYWHFWDSSHPLYSPEAPAGFNDAIEHILRTVDAELGQTLSLLSEDCSVIVVSDHGFGAGHRSLAANRVLERSGFLQTTTGESAGSETASWFTENQRTIDWLHTRVYSPVPGAYGLNLNLKGRQSQGTVCLKDAGVILDEVTDLFRSIRIPETNELAFARVLRREEAFPGPMMESAPDLLLIPAAESLMVTPSVGEEWTWSYQTGLHRHEGMWMHRSPRVTAGRLPSRIRLIDVLPTLFEDLGLNPDNAFQGRAIADIFSHVSHTSTETAISALATSNLAAKTRAGGSDWEEVELSQRLKAMGYL